MPDMCLQVETTEQQIIHFTAWFQEKKEYIIYSTVLYLFIIIAPITKLSFLWFVQGVGLNANGEPQASSSADPWEGMNPPPRERSSTPRSGTQGSSSSTRAAPPPPPPPAQPQKSRKEVIDDELEALKKKMGLK